MEDTTKSSVHEYQLLEELFPTNEIVMRDVGRISNLPTSLILYMES